MEGVIQDLACAKFAAEALPHGHKKDKLLTALDTALMWAKELELELTTKEELGGRLGE